MSPRWDSAVLRRPVWDPSFNRLGRLSGPRPSGREQVALQGISRAGGRTITAFTSRRRYSHRTQRMLVIDAPRAAYRAHTVGLRREEDDEDQGEEANVTASGNTLVSTVLFFFLSLPLLESQ